MSNSYENIFGGITVYPSDLGLINLTITQNTTLVWPDLGETQSAIAASFIRATASSGADFTLPAASNASVAKVLRFKNIGSEAFNVKTAAGNTILTASAGQDWLLSITDNTTTGGAWDVSQVGSGTTSANAASLAGNGLAVSGATLNVSYPFVSISSTPYTIPISGRVNLYEWTGGAGTIEFPDPAVAGNGFFFLLKNQGTGVLTISNVVDNGAYGTPMTLQPFGQGAVFDSDGAAWRSFGYVNLTTLNLNSTYTKTLTTTSVSLTTTEAQNNLITFAGTLSGNTTVNFPAVTFLYDITNSTTGSYTLTVQPSSGTGVTISQGNSRMVVNNASTMYFADTISTGGVVQISTGTGLTGGPITSSGTLSFATISALSLWANNSASAAVPSVVTLGSGLSFSGTQMIATSSFAGAGNLATLNYGPTLNVNASSALNTFFGAFASITSSGTTNIGSVTSTNLLNILGTATITSLGTSASVSNPLYILRASGTPVITQSAATIQGGATITCANGDMMLAIVTASGAYNIPAYFPVSGYVKTINTLTITSTQTYTPSPGLIAAEVRVQAPGGGGGGGGAAQGAGAGGGAGGYAMSVFTPSTLSGPFTVTVGAIGAAGGASSAGGTGGAVIFGAVITCTGGQGGTYTTASVGVRGGAGGTATGGAVMNVSGGGGHGSACVGVGNLLAGNGGASQFGGGGRGASADTVTGESALVYGAGGGGGATAAGIGGSGGPAIVLIKEYLCR